MNKKDYPKKHALVLLYTAARIKHLDKELQDIILSDDNHSKMCYEVFDALPKNEYGKYFEDYESIINDIIDKQIDKYIKDN